MNKKVLVVLFILVLCAGTAFSFAFTTQAGFTVMGMNADISMFMSDSVKLGAGGSVMMVQPSMDIGYNKMVFLSGHADFDVLDYSLSNDLDVRLSCVYLEAFDDSDPMKFAGLTLGLQYTHWFGQSRQHGIYTGFDLPMFGFTSNTEYRGFFVGPFGSIETTGGVYILTMRCGYSFRF